MCSTTTVSETHGKLPIALLKKNDIGHQKFLLDDNILITGQVANAFDLSLDTAAIGYNTVDWADIVSEGCSINYLVLGVFQTQPDGTTREEQYLLYVDNVTFDKPENRTMFSDGRVLNFTEQREVLHVSNWARRDASSTEIFKDFGNSIIRLDITFGACLNVKTSWLTGSGIVTAGLILDKTDTAVIKHAARQTFQGLKFRIVGWVPRLFYNSAVIDQCNAQYDNWQKSVSSETDTNRAWNVNIPMPRDVDDGESSSFFARFMSRIQELKATLFLTS